MIIYKYQRIFDDSILWMWKFWSSWCCIKLSKFDLNSTFVSRIRIRVQWSWCLLSWLGLKLLLSVLLLDLSCWKVTSLRNFFRMIWELIFIFYWSFSSSSNLACCSTQIFPIQFLFISFLLLNFELSFLLNLSFDHDRVWLSLYIHSLDISFDFSVIELFVLI